MNAVAVRAGDASPSWHDQFLTYILPAVEVCARVRFRALPPVEREEARAEAVASAMIAFVRLQQRGRNPVEFARSLARFAVLRVIAGRLSGSADSNGDVLSRQARQERGFIVESLDAEIGENQLEWHEVVTQDRRSTPADIATARIDIADWLGRMQDRRREIAESLAAGYRAHEVAEKFRLSRSRVSQLRREFEDSWTEFQRDRDERENAAA
jgi:DNA-binding NarL/FixJ family response regulator